MGARGGVGEGSWKVCVCVGGVSWSVCVCVWGGVFECVCGRGGSGVLGICVCLVCLRGCCVVGSPTTT